MIFILITRDIHSYDTRDTGNWMWLSASCFFYQYFRVYSPIAFGKKTDKNGDYIRKYLPELKDFPAKYIYEPWKAPKAIQTTAGCVIGRDYPAPIVEVYIYIYIERERVCVCMREKHKPIIYF